METVREANFSSFFLVAVSLPGEIAKIGFRITVLDYRKSLGGQG